MGSNYRGSLIALWAKGTKKKKIKLILLAIILLMFGIIVASFVGYRGESGKDDTEPSLSEEKASVAIGKVHQTATRDGKTEWRLDAGSVRFVEDQKKAFFEDIFITFFVDTGEKIYLTAKEGVLRTDSNDIEVNGDVVIRNMDYRLKTEMISYQHKKRLITSKVPVKISGKFFNLVADTMQVDLNKKNALFKGNIKGNIDESTKH